jgi:hypothetical protein
MFEYRWLEAIVLGFGRVTDRLLRVSEQSAYRFEESNGLDHRYPRKIADGI